MNNTTYSDKMQDFSNTPLNYRVKAKIEEYRRSSASPRHFNTTTSNFFRGLILEETGVGRVK